MPFRTPQEVEQAQQMYEQFKAYIIPAIVYDEYLKNFDFEYIPDEKMFSGHFSDSISLRFNSDVEVFSKKRNKNVMIDFYLTYGFKQPPDWMKTQVERSLNKGEADAHLWIYDGETGQRMEVERIPAQPTLPQFVEFFKNYLRSDLSFDQDGGMPPQPNPLPESPVSKPEPVSPELVNASVREWISMNCKFAKT